MNIDIKIRENKNYKKCVTFVMFVIFSFISLWILDIYKIAKMTLQLSPFYPFCVLSVTNDSLLSVYFLQKKMK